MTNSLSPGNADILSALGTRTTCPPRTGCPRSQQKQLLKDDPADLVDPVSRARSAAPARFVTADHSVVADHSAPADHSLAPDRSLVADHFAAVDHFVVADHSVAADHFVAADRTAVEVRYAEPAQPAVANHLAPRVEMVLNAAQATPLFAQAPDVRRESQRPAAVPLVPPVLVVSTLTDVLLRPGGLPVVVWTDD